MRTRQKHCSLFSTAVVPQCAGLGCYLETPNNVYRGAAARGGRRYRRKSPAGSHCAERSDAEPGAALRSADGRAQSGDLIRRSGRGRISNPSTYESAQRLEGHAAYLEAANPAINGGLAQAMTLAAKMEKRDG